MTPELSLKGEWSLPLGPLSGAGKLQGFPGVCARLQEAAWTAM